MRIRYGNSVEGADYWPRPAISRRIVETLIRGDSASMFGLRRIGKSSILLAVQKELKEGGREVIALDVQSIGHLGNFFKEYLASLSKLDCGAQIARDLVSAKSIPDLVLNFLIPWHEGRGKNERPSDQRDLSDYCVSIGRIIGDRMAQLPTGQRPILLIDEIVDLCEHAKKAGSTTAQIESLLSQLTYWRKRGMPMLITGSIGMHSWIRRNQINANLIQDLNSQDLPPFIHDEAMQFIRALSMAERLDWCSGDVPGWLASHLPSHYPSIIQYALRQFQYAARPTGPLTPEFIAEFVRDQVMMEVETVFLRQFDDRIAGYTPKVTPIRQLIGLVAKTSPPALPYTEFRAKLDKLAKTEADFFEAMLREDGFLTISRLQGVRLASPLVKLWVGV